MKLRKIGNKNIFCSLGRMGLKKMKSECFLFIISIFISSVKRYFLYLPEQRIQLFLSLIKLLKCLTFNEDRGKTSTDLWEKKRRKKQKKKWNSKKHIEDNKFCYLKNRFRHFFNMNCLPAIRFDIKYKYCYPSIYVSSTTLF